MANFSIGLDLQGLVKRVYKTLQYESSFYKMLNDNYIGEVRNTGTPVNFYRLIFLLCFSVSSAIRSPRRSGGLSIQNTRAL